MPLAPIDPSAPGRWGHFFAISSLKTEGKSENMENQLGPEKTLEMIEQDLATFERLSEKEFNAELVKSELEKLSKEELVELQMNMFVQYHQMAKIIVELAEALREALG